MDDQLSRAAPVHAFLEAHHYDGGLRTVPLGMGGARPDWAPDAERVGFRDEFVLGDADQVVEFYRMLHQGRRLTWLAVYRRSVDRSYGDRRNHAGIGVWMVDQMIVDARKILRALGIMAEAVSRDGPETLEADAVSFLTGFLPKFLLDAAAVPAGLHGWSHVSPEESQTKAFSAPPDAPDQPFEHAAGQIAALSWLPGPDPRSSRAVILLRAVAGDPPAGGRLTPEPVERDPLPAILRQIPIALGAMTGEGARLHEQLRLAAAAHAETNQRLDAGKTAHDALTAHAAALQAERDELQRQIETSDPLKMLNRICSDVEVLRRQTAALDQQLPAIERMLRQRGGDAMARSGDQGFASAPQRARPERVYGEAEGSGWSGGKMLGVGLLVAGMVAVIAALIFAFVTHRL